MTYISDFILIIILSSIASSPNGWTDAELGSIWIEQVFEPQTREKLTNPSDYRLLILDGHCSHCTLKFLALAERHRIIILCLPPHTTHALQPCDVGVFGPLAIRYKKEVTKLSKLNIPIRKENLLHVYGKARIASFSRTTIKSAFRKTGIYPLDPEAIPEKLFAPALTTTTNTAQPMPATLPLFINAIPNCEVANLPEQSVSISSSNLLEPNLRAQVLVPSDAMDIDDDSFQYTPEFSLTLPELPSVLPPKASRSTLLTHVALLRKLLDDACAQISADYAQKILMDQENGQLRIQLFLKLKDKDNTRALTSSARVLTHQESRVLMLVSEHAERMKFVHEELPKAVSARAKAIAEREKRTQQAEQQAAVSARQEQRALERQQKEAAKEAEKQVKAASREEERRHREDEKEVERIRKEGKKQEQRAQKDTAREAERLWKAAEKERKATERLELKEQQELAKGTRVQCQKKGIKQSKATLQSSGDKENTHRGPLASIPSQSSTSSAPETQLRAHSDGQPPNLDSISFRVPTIMSRSVFGLHNIDPELLKM